MLRVSGSSLRQNGYKTKDFIFFSSENKCEAVNGSSLVSSQCLLESFIAANSNLSVYEKHYIVIIESVNLVDRTRLMSAKLTRGIFWRGGGECGKIIH